MGTSVGHTTTGVSLDRWARDALAALTAVAGVHRAGLALTEGGGRRLRFTASDRTSDTAVEWCHVDAYDDVPLNTAVRSGTAVMGALDDFGDRYAGFIHRQRATATVALAAIPIVTAGQTLGGFVLFFDRPQPFDARQRQQLTPVGEDLGAALRRVQRGVARRKVAPDEEPVPPGACTAVHQVPPDPAAVAEARRFLRRSLDAWGVGEEATDTAVLCLSELVTNAVTHAHAGCVVRVLLERGILTTTVRDNGTGATGSAEPIDDPLRVHGRGLQLVDALASRWGSQLDSVGTTVWFVLEV